MEKASRAFLPDIPQPRIQPILPLAHGFQCDRLCDCRQPFLRHRNRQEIGKPSNFAGEIAFQIAVVDKENIGQMAVVPPALNVVHDALKWIALARPGKAAAADPAMPKGMNVRRRGRQGFTKSFGQITGTFEVCINEFRVVIPHRHRYISDVTSDDNVFDLGKVGQAVQGKMGLNKAPVLLSFQPAQDFVQGEAAVVQPGRHLTESQTVPFG